MEPLAKYSFLPFMRQGIANKITTSPEDNISDKNRATFSIHLGLDVELPDGTIKDNARSLSQKIGLYGPGEVIGIDKSSIIKVWPQNRITNFEPNYFPYIEFYDEDFPWRYTPAPPVGQKLMPWLTLVVLKEEEFSDGSNVQGAPLPFFTLNAEASHIKVFPDFGQLWGWAHIHVNSDLSNGENNPSAVTTATCLEALLNENADHAYSRIICPRRLESDTSYHAFLIPTFESGRRAGLGIDTDPNLPANTCSWTEKANNKFPFYHRWYFRTGAMGDFEYLVNLLKPKPADKRVGVREMEMPEQPNGLSKIVLPETILRLGGALQVPYKLELMTDAEKTAHEKKFDNWHADFTHLFIAQMNSLVNLQDDYKSPPDPVALTDAKSPDPVISMPLYGRWHAAIERLVNEPGAPAVKWVNRLNLDPRFRVPAGFGTRVVQKYQEEYMQAAWEQIGEVTEVNKMIWMAQIAMEASFFFYTKHLLKVPLANSWLLTTPLHKRIFTDKGTTIFGYLMDSPIPNAVTTGAFRSMTRPRGRIMKRLALGETEKMVGITPSNLLERLNEGKVIAAPPKTAPTGAPNLDEVIKELPGPIPFPAWAGLFKKKPLLIWWILFLAILLLLLALISGTMFKAIFSAAGLGCLYLFWFLSKKLKDPEAKPVDLLSEKAQTPETVDAMPMSLDFVLTESLTHPVTPNTKGKADSYEAVRFKKALKDIFRFTAIGFPEPVPVKMDLPGLNDFVLQQIHPDKTIPARTLAKCSLPPHIAANLTQKFGTVMKYPVIDVPMYKPLNELSTDLFLPNIQFIENNSLTLLENNQKFIEAYMVGINHEFARELLWREYPTDQRGSSFRQFWDVNSFYPSGLDEKAALKIRENLRDIPPIHKWPLNSDLGDHNHREKNGDKAQIVLVVRGELLKKYPTAVIYAHKAAWEMNGSLPDFSKDRTLKKLTPEEEKSGLETIIKLPLFEAKVDPDIFFLGFDLTAEEAKGRKEAGGGAGWFFVIKERPGEPQFGFDVPPNNNATPPSNWKSLHWGHIGTREGEQVIIVNINTMFSGEDQQAKWNRDSTDSAQLAYILYQAPVQVAVHASRMLQ